MNGEGITSLGHLNFRDISYLKKRNMVLGLPLIHVPNDVCGECVKAKQHNNNFNKYFVKFIDDCSRKIWTYLINKKGDVIEVFAKFKSIVDRQSGHNIKISRTDGGG